MDTHTDFLSIITMMKRLIRSTSTAQRLATESALSRKTLKSRTACSASYCVYDEGYRKEGDWALNIKSVITFGRISLVEDEEKAREICTALVRKFTDDEDYLEKELKNALPRVQCLEFSPEHMTGKLVNES